MYFKQFFLGCLAHASYLIACEKSKIAIVVDPQRDIDQYVQEASNKGFDIQYVLLTHFHADFLAGHLELKEKLGAKIMLGSRAKADYQFESLKDKQTIELESLKLEILETPGHTPESISILVYDLIKDKNKPWAVLTGDTLFVGDVGRPDLLASAGLEGDLEKFAAEDLASMLYDSLHQKLLTLPDDTIVYPAHGAGSMCGKNIGKESFSTIGQQKRFNYALQSMSKNEFIKLVCSDQPEAPNYFIHNAVLNKKERKTLEQHLPEVLKALSLESVIDLQENFSAQILDCRSPNEFAKGHLKDSINIGLGGNYASWAGTVLDHIHPIVIIANPGTEAEAAMRLARIGYDNVKGYLAGGMSSLLDSKQYLSKMTRITAQELDSRLNSATAPQILDVRTQTEWNDRHIKGALHIPLNQLANRLAEIPSDVPLVIHCLGGYRSMIAASILDRYGFENISDLIGGINAWAESNLPLEREIAVSTCTK